MNQTETQRAQALTAQMGQPLNDAELSTCKLLGIEPDVFLKNRNEDLANQLPGGPHGLTNDEREACTKLGMSEANFAAEKKRLAGG